MSVNAYVRDGNYSCFSVTLKLCQAGKYNVHVYEGFTLTLNHSSMHPWRNSISCLSYTRKNARQ